MYRLREYQIVIWWFLCKKSCPQWQTYQHFQKYFWLLIIRIKVYPIPSDVMTDLGPLLVSDLALVRCGVNVASLVRSVQFLLRRRVCACVRSIVRFVLRDARLCFSAFCTLLVGACASAHVVCGVWQRVKPCQFKGKVKSFSCLTLGTTLCCMSLSNLDFFDAPFRSKPKTKWTRRRNEDIAFVKMIGGRRRGGRSYWNTARALGRVGKS